MNDEVARANPASLRNRKPDALLVTKTHTPKVGPVEHAVVIAPKYRFKAPNLAVRKFLNAPISHVLDRPLRGKSEEA